MHFRHFFFPAKAFSLPNPFPKRSRKFFQHYHFETDNCLRDRWQGEVVADQCLAVKGLLGQLRNLVQILSKREF